MAEFIDLIRTERRDDFWLALVGGAGEINRPGYNRIRLPHGPRTGPGRSEVKVTVGDDWGAVIGWEVWDAPRGGRRLGGARLDPPYGQPGDTMALSIDMIPRGRTPSHLLSRSGSILWEGAKVLALFAWAAVITFVWIDWVTVLAPSLGYGWCFLLAMCGVLPVLLVIAVYVRGIE